jgi:RNA polymerase sigma factor (sigma-70 family)
MSRRMIATSAEFHHASPAPITAGAISDSYSRGMHPDCQLEYPNVGKVWSRATAAVPGEPSIVPLHDHHPLALYRTERIRLARFVRRILKRKEEVEDIVQEAFIRLLLAARTSTVVSSKAFLYVSARNLAIDALRSRNRRAAIEVMQYQDDGVVTSATTNGSAHASIQLLEVFRVIDRLTPMRRHVFVQRRVFGRSYKEISRATDIAVSTLEKYVSEGVNACHELLD